MITGAPAPSPTFLGGDRFLACGRLAFGPFTLGRVSAVGVRTRALPILWSPRLRLRLLLHYRPDDPGGEFLFADAGELALRLLARGDRHDLLEDLPSHLRQRRALEDDAAVDVHVF